jgi:hypothetical protein
MVQCTYYKSASLTMTVLNMSMLIMWRYWYKCKFYFNNLIHIKTIEMQKLDIVALTTIACFHLMYSSYPMSVPYVIFICKNPFALAINLKFAFISISSHN